jgi:hypothetical protein
MTPASSNKRSSWTWRTIEAAALAAVLVLLLQSRQQLAAVEERVQRLDVRLNERAVASRVTEGTSMPRAAGDATPGDQEALAQRIAALLRANGSASLAAVQRAPAPEREAAPPANDEADSRIRQAQGIVNDALSRGKLARDAVARLRELQARSGNDPRFATLRDEVIAAINQQKLIPEDVAFIAF